MSNQAQAPAILSRINDFKDESVHPLLTLAPFRVFIETSTGVVVEYKPTRLAAVRLYKKIGRERGHDPAILSHGWESKDNSVYPLPAWGALAKRYNIPRHRA